MKLKCLNLLLFVFFVLCSCTTETVSEMCLNCNDEKEMVLDVEKEAILKYVRSNHPALTRSGDIRLLPYVVSNGPVVYSVNYLNEC